MSRDGKANFGDRSGSTDISPELFREVVYSCTERPFGIVDRNRDLLFFNDAGDEYIEAATGHHLQLGRCLCDYVVPTAWDR